jgi:hypothetical protein
MLAIMWSGCVLISMYQAPAAAAISIVSRSQRLSAVEELFVASHKTRIAAKRRIASRQASSFAQRSCFVGLNRISLMSTSSGWLMANATIRAKESAGMAIS